jgi:hypothetical protein
MKLIKVVKVMFRLFGLSIHLYVADSDTSVNHFPHSTSGRAHMDGSLSNFPNNDDFGAAVVTRVTRLSVEPDSVSQRYSCRQCS